MAITHLTPYLFFNGDADDAIRLYERAFDARVEGLMRYEEMPEGAGTCPPEDGKRVMHALLHLGQARVMISDVPSDRPEASGNNVQVLVDFDDVEEMARKFDVLASSGTVVQAIHDAFWGAQFGVLRDEFGVQWMFACQTETR